MPKKFPNPNIDDTEQEDFVIAYLKATIAECEDMIVTYAHAETMVKKSIECKWACQSVIYHLQH